MRSLTYFLQQRLYPATGLKGRLRIKTLQGDGSDRKVYRLRAGQKTFIAVSHPKGRPGSPSENDSFYRLGSHLKSQGLPTPHIFAYDYRGGHFLLEDFGDQSLESRIKAFGDSHSIESTYQQILDLLIKIQVEGSRGFDPAWCYDSPRYDGLFSWERESHYFIRSYLKGFLGIRDLTGRVKREFRTIASMVNRERIEVFLYRDFQSRNIMVRPSGFGLIDFQGGRLGPPQYDLASLLIDPYVGLSWELQERLLTYYLDRLSSFFAVDRPAFLEHYEYIAFQRNLQILGAFSFLSRQKGKTYFEAYIPTALRSLKRRIISPVFSPYEQVQQLIKAL